MKGVTFFVLCLGLVAGMAWSDLSRPRLTHCEWTVFTNGPFGPMEHHSGDLSKEQVAALMEHGGKMKSLDEPMIGSASCGGK